MIRSAFCRAPLCVVLRIEVDAAEYIENAEAFSAQPIFGKGGLDGLLFCLVVTGAAGLLNQVVVESEIRRMCRLPAVARERVSSWGEDSAARFALSLYVPSRVCYQSNLAANSIDEQNGGPI
jgi:hypothetical protein